MTTPPIELAATVERVEIPTVEEIHEATSRIIAAPLLHKVVDWIGVSMREVGRLYFPAPSPAETGAVPVPVVDIQTLLTIAESDDFEWKRTVETVRAWLATVPR